MRKLQLSYFYYFLFSGTQIKKNNFFIIVDIIFLILIPLFYILYFFNNQKKLYLKDGIIIFITIFYFLQILPRNQNILNEIIYYIPILLGYFIFFKRIYLNKNDYRNIVYIVTLLLSTTFIIKSNHDVYKSGIFNSPIGVGVFSLVGIYLLQYSSFSFRIKKIFEIIFLGMILYSNTRGSLIAAAVFLCVRKNINILKIFKYFVLLISSMFLLNLIGVINLKRIIYKYNSKLDVLTGRGDIWNKTIEYYTNENILGSGLGHYNMINYLNNSIGIGNIHNGYLDLVSSFGILLGSFIIVFVFWKLLKYFKIKNNINLGILLSILVLNIGESVIFFTRVPITIIFWISIGNLERVKKNVYKNYNVKQGEK